MKKKKFVLAAAALAFLAVLAAAVFLIRRYTPSSEKMTAEEYFGSLENGEAAVIVEDHLAQEKALIYEDGIYIDYTLVQSELNSRFYWDASVEKLLYAAPLEVYEIPLGGSTYTAGEETLDAGEEILRSAFGGMYLSLDFLCQYTDIKYESFQEPNRVVITFGSREVTTAELKRDTAVRYQGGIKSPILTEAEKGSLVTVLEEMDQWSRVLTEDGYIGYVKNSRMKDFYPTRRDMYREEETYTSLSLGERVNLVWHQINYPEMNQNFADDTGTMTGVNVISPTWYFLADNEGAVDSYADAGYVEEAHARGLQVWALISNFSENVSTTELLASRAARQRVQEYLVCQALTLGFDGINIDFEGIAQEAGPSYVQFMRELSILCRKNQIYLSVDVPVPMDFSRHYDREELGTVCDYVIMMGYDEHYAGSDLVGSVASMEFERTGIENMLTEVPGEKMISAIPFYSRLWYTETLEDGSVSVTSEAVTMEQAGRLVEENGAEVSFDESAGQQYAQWTDEEGRLCQIWLEDEDSVRERASMISEYGLGGIAAWVLGNEEDFVWEIISEEIA